MQIKNPAGISAYNNISNITDNISQSKNNDNFSNMVGNAIEGSINTIKQSEHISSASLVNDVSLEELASAVSNAEITLKTVVAVRDKIISAYQDIIKMPI